MILKTEEQIDGIRKSCVLASQALEYAHSLLKPGLSTEKLNKLIEKYINKNGGKSACLNYRGFPKSCCTSINEVVCHGIPNSKTILKEGDIIGIDIATNLNNYIGDVCGTYGVGIISKEANNLIQIARECLKIGIDQIKIGEPINKIGPAIENFAKQQGYSIVKEFGGHGVGINLHEDPFIFHYNTIYKDDRLFEAGMVFTIEPMVNAGSELIKIKKDRWTVTTQDKKLSAQFEHTIAIHENSIEILTFN